MVRDVVKTHGTKDDWYPKMYGPIDLAGHYIPWPEGVPRMIQVGTGVSAELMEVIDVVEFSDGTCDIIVERTNG